MNPDTFIDALRTLEADKDPEPLASLYAEDATSGNTALERTFDGPDGARDFWSHYRSAFDTIESEFRNVVSQDDTIILEWVSKATVADGDELDYEGVTVLETDGELITRSTAYFDPRTLDFGPPPG